MHAGLAARLREGDETFAITGATGWFGRVTLDLLREALGEDGVRARVRPYSSANFPALAPADVVLHFAYLTQDRVAGAGGPAAFMAANLALTVRVLEVVGDDGVLAYTSSGAAHRTDPYGLLKRADEELFAARPGPTVTARVFNVAGPHMTKARGYALGDLIARALAGEPLVVKAPRPVLRSYVAVADVVQLMLLEALDRRGGRFETAGERVVEVGELADAVRRALGRPDLPIERPELDPTLPEDRYVGDGAAMRALADRHGLALMPLDDQIRATAGH